jgi:hypothetical protein
LCVRARALPPVVVENNSEKQKPGIVVVVERKPGKTRVMNTNSQGISRTALTRKRFHSQIHSFG